MALKEPTKKEMQELVEFGRDEDGELFVHSVLGDVWGSVLGHVLDHVEGSVGGNIGGSVRGSVKGKINGREWQFVEESDL